MSVLGTTDIVSQFDYSSAVMRRFLYPQYAGQLLSHPDVLTAQAGTRERGASIRLWLQVKNGLKNGLVVQARFLAYGCPHFIAAAEMLCEWSERRPVKELSQWSWQSLQAELDIPTAKRGKLLLLEDVLHKAVNAN